MGEHEPQSEHLIQGELLCLYHPGTPDIFSGYGLVMTEDWPGHLAGILIVDRPFPADPDWLQQIQTTYGECQLVPMTTRGDRGLVCQMHIEPESLQHLRRFAPGFGQPLQNNLRPLLEEPPPPTLALRWDEDHGAWFSEMMRINPLPQAIREVFEQTGYGCLAVEGNQEVVHVCHAAEADIAGFVGSSITAHWELIEMPTAPLIRLSLLVYDSPAHPYRFESFLNVAAADQREVLAQLAGQEALYLAFYGDDLTYRYTAAIAHDEQQWQRLDEIMAQAELYWQRLPEERRDFDQAKALFIHIYS